MPADDAIARYQEDIRKLPSRRTIIAYIDCYRLVWTIFKDSDTLPGITKLLLHVYGEELEIHVRVSSIESMAAKIHVKVGA
jgi:hypothetical protein